MIVRYGGYCHITCDNLTKLMTAIHLVVTKIVAILETYVLLFTSDTLN